VLAGERVNEEEIQAIQTRFQALTGNRCECSSIVELPVDENGKIDLSKRTASADFFFPDYHTEKQPGVKVRTLIRAYFFLFGVIVDC
jgi:hypothetical protein